ncbi:Solute carrier family 15 member 2 like protein [Argiope bruennichi]|uniref:Oligopeptide transporter 1 n=1 Tax=Argiope bruennichi TaxID=94029 RepID=A0A8T0FA98_ARGBR|nr:Solute carrier family 15 member 2 like protein [Argiope bruennichi]
MSEKEAVPSDQTDAAKPKINEDKIDTESEKQSVQIKDQETNPKKTPKAKSMPKGIYFLLGNEFCERFSFYGMRTVLTLFLVRQLGFDEDVAASIFHGFQSFCYFTPIFGAILADSWLSKFRTIFYVSILYAIGNITLSVGAIPHSLQTMKVLSLTGLFVIGLGTGGIKPCVSAFGGDQFTSEQIEIRKYFFSLFYFSINLGSLLSTIITPALRGDIRCFGQNTCFSLAFLIPALLFVIALVVFLIGKPLYIIKPAEGSVFVSVFRCIGYALFKKATAKDVKKEHWLEYADDKYDEELINDIRCLQRVLLLLIPLPVFWALYEQQGSKWVLQASKMNGEVYGSHIKPDHMQVINPLLILVLIPIFDNVIYPLALKCNICRTPLQRMTIGGLLCAFSFVIAAIIEVKIEAEFPDIPSKDYSDMLTINNSPCHLDIKSSSNISLNQFESVKVKQIALEKSIEWKFTPSGCSATGSAIQEVNATSLYETMMITLENDNLRVDISSDSRVKEKDGSPRVRLLFSIDYQFTGSENASFFLQGNRNFYIIPENVTRPGRIGMTEYCSVDPSKYKLYLPSNGTKIHEETAFGELHLETGGSYIVYIYQNKSASQKELHHTITMMPNSVHILWQIPQLVIITVGEVMFSITGLDFSYSQAPSSLKSIVQAAWLLTSAIGNLLVVLLVNIIQFDMQSLAFLMYASIMTLSMVIFGIVAYYYKYMKEKENSY